MYKEYAKVNGKGIVVALYNDVFQQVDEKDICVNIYDGEYDISRHIGTMLADGGGHYNYKVKDGKLTERTDVEKAQEILLESTTAEQTKTIEAQGKLIADLTARLEALEA